MAAQKAHREAEVHEIKKAQENAATDLGLWPHVAKRRAGRFGKAALWESALYREIEDDRPTADLKRLRPAWSSSDQPLRRTEEDAVTDLHIVQGGPVETTKPPNKMRRQHRVVGGDAKDWFMSLRGVHPSWFTAECLRFAQRLAPEIFGPVCVLTVWNRDGNGGVVGGHQNWSPKWSPVSPVSCRSCAVTLPCLHRL